MADSILKKGPATLGHGCSANRSKTNCYGSSPRSSRSRTPGLEEDLRETYEFDSIDAIELLREIELMLGTVLTRDEKEAAMEIRTLGQIIDYVRRLAAERADSVSVAEKAGPP